MAEGTAPRVGRVLFVDDEPENLELFRLQFESTFDVITAAHADEAVEILSTTTVAVLLTDERMPGMRGVELLALAARRWPDVVRVIVSAYGDAARLLAAINFGHAHEYVLKPWDVAELRACIDRALTIASRRRSLEETASTAVHVGADAAARYPLRQIIGRSSGLAPALALAARVASKAMPVLVAGERGTGKELVARYLHAESKRSGPFLRLGCSEVGAERMDEELFGAERDGVVARGRLESASRGTLFLDDIAELSLAIQAELAHALDEGCFERVGGRTPVPLSARLLAATHRDVPALVRADRFSAQLQYHFNVVVPLPPLRERGPDIAQLALHFADKHAASDEIPLRIDDDALVALSAYAWPGNVRELESIVARAVALAEGPSLTVDDFTFRLDLPSDAELSLRQEAKASEALELRRLLLAHGGNLASAARALGIPRTTLLGRAKKLGLLS